MAELSSIPSVYPFSYQIPLKLNNENYLSWKYLVLPHVRGHDLLGFLDGSQPAPSESTSTGVNPAYKIWSRQDQLLLAWLLSSISESVVSQVVHCTTSADLWKELQSRFYTQSMACVMDLKVQLHSLHKGHLSMQNYLDQKKSIDDHLRLIGSPVSEADLQLYILHGLSIEYDPLIVSLNAKSAAVPFNELAGLLLTHEQRIQKYALITASTPSDTIPPSLLSSSRIPQANLATSQNIIEQSVSSDDTLLKQFHVFLASKGGSWRARHPSKGFANPSESSDKPTCQLCSKKGHIADRCYKRFDSTFKPPPRPPLRNRPSPPPGTICSARFCSTRDLVS
jgi:gag-polypeptide of LTR copia-type